MSRKNNLDKFKEVMFAHSDELAGFTEDEKEQLSRYRFAFTLSLDNPTIPDRELRDELISKYKISVSQAYRDIGNVKIILPSVRNAGREWIRYLVNEELKKVIQDINQLLEGDMSTYGEDKDGNPVVKPDYTQRAALLNAKTAALDKIGKYNKLNKEDEFELNWDEIVPQSIEPTNDVSVLDVKPMDNPKETKRKLYEKYKNEIEIEDVGFQDIETGEDYGK
jgi:hypothetical protein